MSTPNSPLLRATSRLRTSSMSPTAAHPATPFSPDPSCPTKATKYARRTLLAALLLLPLLALALFLLPHTTSPTPLRLNSNPATPHPTLASASVSLLTSPHLWLPHYRTSRQKSAVTKPVRIALMTGHFFDRYSGPVHNCTYFDQPLQCSYYSPSSEKDCKAADVLWYHAPSMCDSTASVPKYRSKQLTVVMSMESAKYYPCLDDPAFMAKFDMEMTYRLCSQVPVHYLVSELARLSTLQQPPLPLTAKRDAIAFVNSNCNPLSGRQAIVDAYLALPTPAVPLHSYGGCANNMGGGRTPDKLAVFRTYKFCITMENSISPDYVTEKVWHGLMAGCVPIYLGAPNIYDFVPEPQAIINYAEVGSVQALAALLEALVGDEAAYEARLAWKWKPLAELAPGFQSLVARSEHSLQHSRCQLCQAAVAHRIQRRRYTTCLFNETWLARARSGSAAGAVAAAAAADTVPPAPPAAPYLPFPEERQGVRGG